MTRCQPTSPRVRYHVLLYVIAAAVLAGGCRDGDDGSGSAYKLRTTAFKSTPIREPGESGTRRFHACGVLRTGLVRHLTPSANDSLDLSICEWDGRGMHVRLMVDSAPKAQLRYYN